MTQLFPKNGGTRALADVEDRSRLPAVTRSIPLSPSAHLRIGIVLRELDAAKASSIVEVGPGQGGISWHLAYRRRYLGFEPDVDSFRVAHMRLQDRPQAEILNETMPEQPVDHFDSLVALEVLEHIEDDARALLSWREWVRPGGIILLSVPAKRSRYGPYDREVGHFRRYDRSDLEAMMAGAGLIDVGIYCYGMPLGYALEAVRNRLLARRLSTSASEGEKTSRSGRSFQPSGNARLIAAATLPFRMLQRPFESTDLGIGWVTIGRVT